MNLSARWCVSALAALSALGCSDPVPPAAQGAFIVSINSVSPSNGKACPAPFTTFDVPEVYNTSNRVEALNTNTYLHWTIDGESDSNVSCSVKGSSSFTFGGRIASGVSLIEISDGTLANNMTGTARINIANGSKLSTSLTSPAADCKITVVTNSRGTQVRPGSIWASFECPSLEHQPGDACSAKGVFVLENCSQ